MSAKRGPTNVAAVKPAAKKPAKPRCKGKTRVGKRCRSTSLIGAFCHSHQPAAQVAPPPVDLHALGARVRSVFGPFNSRVLIEMSTDKAAELFPNGALSSSGPMHVVDAVDRDVDEIRKAAPALADSALAAAALALAYEIADPYNSATAKAACTKALMEAMATLRELAPPAETKDDLDSIIAGRVLRLATAGGTDSPD